MSIRGKRKALYLSGLVIGGMIIFAMGAYLGKALLARNRALLENSNASKNTRGPLVTEGFDFRALRAANNEWRGPDLGMKIDLTRLHAQDGKTLASLIEKRPIMIVGVHPECGMCKIAGDEMSHLREKLSTMNIKYYLASFASQPQPAEFFQFTDALGVGAPGFLWNTEAGAPPDSLVIMTTPTHLLVNYDGTVLHVWPGSYQDMSVRQRMARQIVADTFVAIDTLNAVSSQPGSQESGASTITKLR